MVDDTLVAVLAFTKPTLQFLSAAAWPISAAYIATRFKGPISEAIRRASRVSALGATVDLPLSPQQNSAVENTALSLPATALSVSPEPHADVLLEPYETKLLSELDNEPLDQRQKLKWAVRVAAINNMAARHSEHYRMIFGTQIAFLKHVNMMHLVTIESAQRFFADHTKGTVPSQSYTFDNWLRYIAEPGSDLEIVSGPDGAAALQLTQIGRAFLVWIAAVGAAEAKPF